MRRVWPWVVMAPLGLPVVPEVKTRSERSPPVIDAVRPAATSAEQAPPSWRKTSHSTTGSPLARRRPGCGLVGAQDHHPLEVGHRLPGRHRLVEQARVVGAEEALHGEEHPGPGLAQDVGGLGPLEPGVQRHEHGAGAHRAQGGDHPLGAVRRPDGHPVATVDPVGHDGPGGRGHLLGQLVEGQPGGGAAGTVHVDQRLGLPEAGGGILDQAGDGPPLEIPSGIGHI